MAKEGGDTAVRWATIVAVSLALATPILASGATILVPTDFPTIQSAVDAAAAGDTIRVQPGTYQEVVRIRNEQHGLTIEAADEANPPLLLGTPGTSNDGIRIDRVNDVSLRNLSIRGAYDGVRANNADRVLVDGLHIENTALAIRLYRGVGHRILACDIRGTHVEQGVLVDHTADVTVADVTIAGTRREGVLALQSPGVTLTRISVAGNRGSDGIRVSRSPGATVAGCTSTGNYRDGLRAQNSHGLVLLDNQANGNTNTGLRIDRCRPFFSVDDVLAGGNRASGNLRRDIVVNKPSCSRATCPASTTTTTISATSTSSTTVTPTTTPSSPPTSVTTTTGPLTVAHWRLYVRTALAQGGIHDVNVPFRSIEAPLTLAIRSDHVAAFSVNDQVLGPEIAALGGDTLQRFVDAAVSYVAAHPTDYPGVSGILEVRWAMRVP